MTYITYQKTQYVLDMDGPIYDRAFRRYSKPPEKIPSILPKSNFMPSYLVRTSDMKLVKGSDVHEGYCTLSYSWGQSGDVLIKKTTGKSYRVDQGKHKIIYSGKTSKKKPRGRKRTSDRSKFVTFEGLIQELCKDFNIKYIWYDQMCINQNNEKEKHDEIHRMHKIYGNAYCTLALVPELGTEPYKLRQNSLDWGYGISGDFLTQSQWMERMWTLEEAIMSRKMIVVGRNVHFWGDHLSELGFAIFDEEFESSAPRVLHYAHTRTSTKEHDHVFALANIFPDIMKQITVNYKQDIQELMIQFYGLLAKKDIHILCFGSYLVYNTICNVSYNNNIEDNGIWEPGYNLPVQKFNLPSWTGIYGEHDAYNVHKTSFKNYTVKGRILKLTCNGITNKQDCTEISTLQSIENILPPFPQQNSNDRDNWRLVIRVQPQGSMNEKLIEFYDIHKTYRDSVPYGDIIERLQELSRFMPIKTMNLEWIPNSSELSIPTFTFDVVEELLEDSGQYVLLTGIPFEAPDVSHVKYPVIKKEGEYYKAIGMCNLFNDSHFFDDLTLEEQTFEIH